MMPLQEAKSLDLLIENRESKALKDLLRELSADQIANLLLSRSEEEQHFLFPLVPQDKMLATFDFFPVYLQRILMKQLPTPQVAMLLQALSPDDRTSFLEELPRETINGLIKLLPTEDRLLSLRLLGYPEGSIGRLMTPDYLAVGMDWTIEEVLDHIQAYGHDSETIDVIYVVDEAGKLLDDIRLKDLLFVPRQFKVESIANYQFAALSVYDTDESAINIFKYYDRIAMPVIDQEGTLLGIVTIDDILRLSSEEATEDMQKIGGMEALDEPYLQAPFFELIRKRAGWLTVLFLGEMLTATAMSFFSNEIAKAVVLALFLPLIISSGGNAGSQASTLVIRAMALGEVKLRDWWRVVRREIFSGLALGLILGIIGFFRITIWSAFSDIYGEHWFLIALTIGLSLIAVVLWGTISGATFPLLLRACKVDPATSSTPFVATIVDVTGLIIYFLIALVILRGTLL